MMIVNGRTALAVGALAAGGVTVGVAVARRTRRGRVRREGALPHRADGGYVTVRAVTVDRPADEIRKVFRDAERLRVALDRQVSIEPAGAESWCCRIDDGSGRGVEAAVRRTGNLLSWQVERGRLAHEGRLLLTPAPGDRGTELRVELRYPGSRIGRLASGLRGRDPDQVLRTTLRRLKSVLECGQVVSTMRDPSGRGPVAERITRVAREKLTTGGRP